MLLPDFEPEGDDLLYILDNLGFHPWAGMYKHQGMAICTGSLGKFISD
jgi:hypothetical protein